MKQGLMLLLVSLSVAGSSVAGGLVAGSSVGGAADRGANNEANGGAHNEANRGASSAANSGASGGANSGAAATGVTQLQQFVAATPRASGQFKQTLLKDDGKAGPVSSGVFAYARPGKLRWDIQKPYEQLILSDGEKLYLYDKDLQQVTIKPVSEAMNATPAALLFGRGDIGASFTLAEDADAEGLSWVVAVPLSKEAGFERVRVGLKDGIPARMDVVDGFGQRTRFEFEALDAKAAIADDQFRFTVPDGVDVVQ